MAFNFTVCALNGKYSSLNKQRHPESESLLCVPIDWESISKSQGGLPLSMH